MDNPETLNIGHKTQKEDKTTKQKAQCRKLKRWATRPHQKGQQLLLLIVKFSKSLFERENIPLCL